MNLETIPTLGQITDLAIRYDNARQARNDAQAALALIEDEVVELVEKYGIPKPNAEKSRYVSGLGCDLLVTHADSVSVVQDKVLAVKSALEFHSKHIGVFETLFKPRVGYEALPEVHNGVSFKNKRFTERINRMLKNCFKITPKKPSLKVNVTDEARKIASQAAFKEYAANKDTYEAVGVYL